MRRAYCALLYAHIIMVTCTYSQAARVRVSHTHCGICWETAVSGNVTMAPITCKHARYDSEMDADTPEQSQAASLWVPLRSSTGRVAGVMAVYAVSTSSKDRERGGRNEGLSESVCAVIVRLAQEHASSFAGVYLCMYMSKYVCMYVSLRMYVYVQVCMYVCVFTGHKSQMHG